MYNELVKSARALVFSGISEQYIVDYLMLRADNEEQARKAIAEAKRLESQ